MRTLRDHRAKQSLLLRERSIAAILSRDPRPLTMDEQDMEYAMVRVRSNRTASRAIVLELPR